MESRRVTGGNRPKSKPRVRARVGTLTPKRVEALLRDALPAAREFDQQLRRVFELSEAQSRLRLKWAHSRKFGGRT